MLSHKIIHYELLSKAHKHFIDKRYYLTGEISQARMDIDSMNEAIVAAYLGYGDIA